MEYNYDKLWNLLDSRGLSKTDLRVRTGISTATLAKLSAGEAVSLDVLAKLSKVLGTGIDGIISISDNAEPERWSCIGNDRKFLIHIVVSVYNDTASYILGYAAAYEMTDEGIDKWSMTKYTGIEFFYCINGYANSNLLKELLSYAENGLNLGQFVHDKEISVNRDTLSQKIVDEAMKVKICNGKMDYHPPFILQYRDIGRFCSHVNMPVISPYESSAICEGFEGKEKRNLYVTEGRPDHERMDMLYSIFREEFPNGRDSTYMGMLANFEIFSNLNGCYDESFGVNVTVEGGGNSTKVCQIFHITFDHTIIGKNIVFEFVGYNYDGVNPVCDFLKEIDCTRQRQTWNYNSYQLISRFELKIWDNDRFSDNTSRLLYHVGHSLIMGFDLDINASELSYNLKDEWERIISKSGKAEELKPNYVTHMSGRGIDKKNEKLLVKNDFRNFITLNSNKNKGGFFDKGSDKQVNFLLWLKATIAEEKAERIIIIDPYIKAKSIAAILRCLTDYTVPVEVFLDEDKDKDGKNVTEIKKIEDRISDVIPNDFSIFGVSGVLHDRYVILLGKTDKKVYMLSNSIDSVAENYASTSVLVDKDVATQIIRHYLILFSHIPMDVILKSRKMLEKEQGERQRTYVKMPDSIRLPEKICSVEEAKKVIDLFITKAEVKLDSYRTRLCIGAGYLLAIKGILTYKYLMDVQSFVVNRITYEPFTWMSPILYEAVCFLKNNSMQDYFELSDIVACPFPQVGKERDIVCGFISMLIICAVSDNKTNFVDNGLIMEQCLTKTDTVFYKALATAEIQLKLMEQDVNDTIKLLKTHLLKADFLTGCVFLLKSVKEYSKGYIQLIGEERIRETEKMIENHIVEAIGVYLSESDIIDRVEKIEGLLTPFYRQWSGMISEIVVQAVNAGSISPEVGQSVLVNFIMKRFENYENDEHAFYSMRDIEDSFQMFDKMYDISSKTPSKLKKMMKKIEMGAVQKLYAPFLKNRDYTAWKKYIDVLGCMVCLETYISERDGKSGTSRALNEFMEICKNYDTLLQKYSEVYRTVLAVVHSQKD